MSEQSPKNIDFIAEIGGATGSIGLLEFYNTVREEHPEMAEQLQRAVAKKCLAWGDTETGLQFIVLADETANQNAAKETAKMSAEVAHRNAQTSGRMIDASIRVHNAVNNFEVAIGSINRNISGLDQALSPLNNAVRVISEAAQTIYRATGGMTEAAHTMDSASRRMRG